MPTTSFIKRISLPEIIFWILLFASILPIIKTTPFFTLDGSQHCYNTIVLKQLLSNDEWYKQVFAINHFPVPNYLGTILLLLLDYVLPIQTAEKTIPLLFFILTPIFFRKIVRQLKPDDNYSSIIIFPFLQCIFIYYGFYNFCIGLTILFYGIYHRIKYPELSRKNLFVIFFICTGLYFSHVFTFLIFIVFLAAQCIKEKFYGETFLRRLMPLSKIAMALSPLLILTFLYFQINPSTENNDKWSVLHILRFIYTGEYFNYYYFEFDWIIYTLSVYFCLLTIYLLVKIAFQFFRNGISLKLDHIFLITGLSMLLLAFLFPNSNGNATYITYRFLYLFVLFVLLFIACQQYHRVISIIFISMCTCTFIHLQTKVFKSQRELLQEYKKVIAIQPLLKPRSTVASLFFNGNNFSTHFASYLSLNENIILLDNYEASTNYFPVIWAPGTQWVENLQKIISQNHPSLKYPQQVPDYILINARDTLQGDYSNIINNIRSSYINIYSVGAVYLYKKSVG